MANKKQSIPSSKPTKPKIPWKSSNEILFDSVRYALDYQWDVFKHYDSKAATIVATSGTILIAYIGVQFSIFNIINNIKSGIPSIISIQMLNVVLFFAVLLCSILSIGFGLSTLRLYKFKHPLDPVELIANFKDKSELSTRILSTKALASNWFKNQDTISNKIDDTTKAVYCLISAIITLIFSILFSSILI
jgi:hypothetical protein